MALLTDADVFGPAPGAGGGLLTDEDVFGPSPVTEIDAGATVTNIPARSSPREVSWGDVVSGVADTMGPMMRRQVAGLMQYGANGEMTAGERADVMGSRYFGEAKGETEQETQAEIEARRAEVRQSSARIAEEAARDMAAARPDVDPNSVKGFAYDFAVSMANMAPAVAATIATRQPAIGMSMIGGQVFGDQYAESREKGRTHDQAIQDGVFMAAAEAIPEAIPLGVLARPGASMVSRFFKGTVAEGVQEMFTQALQDGYSAGILDEDMTWGQAMENLARAGLLGSAMGGSFAVATEPFVRGGRDAPVGPGDAPPVPPATGREDEPERDEGGTSSVVAGSRVRISDPGGPLDGQEATVTNPGTPDSPGVEVDVGGETRTIGKSLLRPVEPKRMAPVTPEDVASPIATDKISRGKAMLDDAAAGRPLDIERPAEGTSAAPEGVSPEPEALTRSAEPLSSVRQEPDAVGTADAVAPPGPEWRPIYSDTTRGEQVGWVNPQTGEEVALDTAPRQRSAEPAQATPAPAPAVPARQQQDVPVTGNPLTDQDVGLAPQQASTAQDNRATAAPPSAERVAQAAAETDTAPTEAQKEAGNYRKGKVRYAGHEISIENPRGSQRSGTDPNGEAWSVTMPADYGYIRRSTGADGDQVDVYLGQGPETGPVFVVDQVDADTGRFDEHKAFMGFPTRAEAEAAYRAAFSDGRGDARMGAVTEMSQDQFKAWLRDGDQTKPAGRVRRPRQDASQAGRAPIGARREFEQRFRVPRRPASLTDFVRARGGIKSTDQNIGDIRGIADKGAFRLLSRDGMPLDQMRLRAAEAGYLPMDTTNADFLALLDQDVAAAGDAQMQRVYSQSDGAGVSEYQQAARTRAEAEREFADVDLGRFPTLDVAEEYLRSVGDLRNAVDEAERRLDEIDAEADRLERLAIEQEADYLGRDDTDVANIPFDYVAQPGQGAGRAEPPRPAEGQARSGDVTGRAEDAGPRDRSGGDRAEGAARDRESVGPAPTYEQMVAQFEGLRYDAEAYHDLRVRYVEQYPDRIDDIFNAMDEAGPAVEATDPEAEQDRADAAERTQDKVARIQEALRSGARVQLVTQTRAFQITDPEAIRFRNDAAEVITGYSRGRPRWDRLFEGQVDGLIAQLPERPNLREEGPPESTTPDPDGYIDQWQDLAARLDGVTGRDARVAVADAWVREEGARTGHEHVAIFDGDGRLIQAGTQGKERAIGLSGATKDRRVDPNARMVATHNHPGKTAPSLPDVSQLAHKGIEEVRVMADEVIYSVTLPDAIKEQAGTAEQFGKFLARIDKVAFNRMRKAISGGTISVSRASEVYQHLVNVLLHRLGVTNYVTTLPKEQITPAEMAVIDKALPMARAIAGNLSNRTEQSEADVYRSTVPVRSGEGLAEVRGRGEDARPVDPRSEMGARADRRAEEAAGRTALGGLTPRRQGARFRLQDTGDRTTGEASTENVTGSLFSRGPGGTNRGDDRTSFSKDGTTYTWDPELLKQADDLVRYLRRQVRQMNPNAKVLVVDKVIQDSTGRTGLGVSTEDIPEIGRAIVVAMRYVDENGKVRPNPSPGDTLNHEVMHDLRRQGLFTAEEESVLFGNSDRNRLWRRRFEVDRLYDGEPDAVRREEAAAMAWEAWKAGRLRVAGRIRRAFQKVDRFLRALANWVSGKGFTATEPPFLDREAEQVFERIDAGEVGRREPGAGAPGDGSRFSVVAGAGRQTDTAAFKRWFGDSKVVDENGEPLRVFHGSRSQEIESFDTVDGAYFTPDEEDAASYPDMAGYDPEGRVYGVYLSIQDPLEVSAPEFGTDTPVSFMAESRRRELEQQGYDGAIARRPDGSIAEIVAFRPEQIKSATGNRGTFDPADPRIRYSFPTLSDRTAAEKKVARRLTEQDRALIDRHLAPAGGGLISRLARASFIRDIARDGLADTLVTKIISSLNPIFAYEKRAEAMTGGIPKVRDASVSAAKMAEFTMNDTGRTWAMFHAGPMRYDADQGIVVADETVPGLYDIFKYLSDPAAYDRFRLYAAARRAERLAAEGRENNMTDAAIARGLDLADETGRHKGETRTFRQVFDDYQRFNKALLEGMGRDTGMMSQEDIDFYTEHMDYTPFYREAEETGTVPTGAFLRKNINKPDAGIKKLEGGEQRIADLMENIVRNAEAITRAGMRNVTMRRIYEIAEVLGEGQIVRDGAAEDGVLTYRVNGREVKFTVDDPSLVAAVASMRPEQHTGLYKALVSITGFFRASITAMPGFMIRNLMRGTEAGFVQTGKNISLQHNVATGLKRAWRNDRSIRELKAITGTGSYTFGGPSGNAAGLLRRSTGAQRDFMPISVVKSVWGALERAGEATELADRDAIYNNLIREGATKAEAAYQAMNLINYSRKGSSRSLRVLLPLVPFLNARIQGLYRMGETQTGGVDRRKILAGVAVRGLMMTAMSVALREVMKDDDRYDDEPLHRKLNYWIIYIGDSRILIPKPFEFGAIFATLPELILDAIEQKEGKRLAEGLAQTLLTTFAFNPIPQPALPMIENIANYNFFTGREIENQRLKNLPAGQRYTAATPQVLREIGKATDLSPAQMENLIRGYTGSMGMSLLAGLDSIGRAAGAFPSEPTGPFGDYGIFSDALQDQLGSMYREGPDRSNRWVGDLYELSRDINQTYRHVESLVEEGEMEAARKAAEEGRIEWRTFVNRQVKALSTINAQIRAVEEDPSLTGAYKRTELNKLYEIRNRIAEMAVKEATGRE